MENILNDESLFINKVNEIIESSHRKQNRRLTIISRVLGLILHGILIRLV